MSEGPDVTVTFDIHRPDWVWQVAEEDYGIVLRYFEWRGSKRKMIDEFKIPTSDAKAICDAIMAVAKRIEDGGDE